MNIALLLVALAVSAAPADTAEEEKSIREFLGTRQEAFIREDTKWLVGHFTENGELVDSFGKSAKGRAQIEKKYRAIFDAPHHHDVKTVHTVEEVRCVTPDVAVVRGSWKLSGLKDEQKKPLPDRQGGSVMVLLKQDGEWQIDLLQADIKVHPKQEKADTEPNN